MKKFSPTRTISKKNIEKVPGNKSGVYRIKDQKEDILYIGKAKARRLDDRIWEHRGRFKKGTKFQYCTTKTAQQADNLERSEIRKHTPPRNKK